MVSDLAIQPQTHQKDSTKCQIRRVSDNSTGDWLPDQTDLVSKGEIKGQSS